MFSPMARRAKKIAWKPRADLRAISKALARSVMGSADPYSAAQDALGPDDEDDDEEQEATDVLHVVGDHQRRQLDEAADDQAADERAVRGAETTQGDAGEHEQQQPETHVPLDLVGQPQQHASQRGQRRAHDPHDQDHPVHVDAGGRREVAVVRDGTHGLADLGALQHRGDEEQDDDGDDDREQRPIGHREDAVVDRPLVLVADVGVGESAVDDLDQVAQGQRQADRDDQRGDQPGAAVAQRAPQAEFGHRADGPADHHGDQGGRDERDVQVHVDVPGDDRADRDQLAVREVRQPRRPEDQRQAHGAHRDEQTEPDAVDEELDRTDVAAAGVPAAVVETDDDRLVAARTDGDRAAVLPSQDDAPGQLVLVDRDDVLTGAGQVDRPFAFGAGLHRVDLVAGGGGDRDRDAPDRAATAGLHRAEHLFALGRRDPGDEGGQSADEDEHEDQPERDPARYRRSTPGTGSRVRHATSQDGVSTDRSSSVLLRRLLRADL